jgi:hypothetical protein
MVLAAVDFCGNRVFTIRTGSFKKKVVGKIIAMRHDGENIACTGYYQ